MKGSSADNNNCYVPFPSWLLSKRQHQRWIQPRYRGRLLGKLESRWIRKGPWNCRVQSWEDWRRSRPGSCFPHHWDVRIWYSSQQHRQPVLVGKIRERSSWQRENQPGRVGAWEPKTRRGCRESICLWYRGSDYRDCQWNHLELWAFEKYISHGD